MIHVVRLGSDECTGRLDPPVPIVFSLHSLMEYALNHLNQPVGPAVQNWTPPPHPRREIMQGRFCRLEPLDPMRHAEALYAANALDSEGRNWTYLPYGPFDTLNDYRGWIEQNCCGSDPLFFAIVDVATGTAAGVASYLRISPDSGSIEVGHLNYSPLLQRTPAATEAMYLMMSHAFDLGYRRYEWKCNALNAASRAAAQRLGLSFEGVFRQATVTKGRSRDTAWHAAIDQEWPALKEAFLQWLSPSNFDEQGKQRSPLSVLTAPILKQHG
jgi:RimJ/RimL family protein N-acetyltransferase